MFHNNIYYFWKPRKQIFLKEGVRERGHTIKLEAHLNKRQPAPGREKRCLEPSEPVSSGSSSSKNELKDWDCSECLDEFSEQMEVAFPTEVIVLEVKCHWKMEGQSYITHLGF